MVSIKKANSEIKEADVSYLGKNILTKISKDTEGNSLVELAFKDKPEFSELTLGGTSLRIDNGNLTIGGNTVVTTNNIGSQEISYKVNDEPTSSKVSLNTGFTFKGDMDNNIKVSKDNDGIINFNLSSTLSGITSISNGDKKIEITNEGVKIGDVTINGNTINIKNVDATKTPQNGDVITYEYFNKTINNLNVGKATQDELDKKANKDASNLDDGDITKWKEKLGVTNLDLKVQGTNGSYTTTLANGVVFENGDIDVKATASSDTSKKEGKLKLTLKEEYKKKLNAIDIEDNKKLSDVYLKVDASNLSDTGVNNLITKLGTGNGALTDSNKNKLVTGNTLDATLQSKFIKFMGDENTTYDGNEQGTKVNLDGTLNIKGGVVRKEKDKDDETKEKELQNILVKTDKDKISLDLSKDLYGMNSIEFVNKHGNKSTININDNGDLVINNNKGNTSTIITSNTILEQDINYRVNGVTRIRKPNEKLTLKDGLNFIKDDNDNIKITDDGNLGDIKFNLNKNLKGIKTVGINDKTNITFDNTVNKEKVDIKVAGKTLSITRDADGIKVSGITDKNVEDTNYGASGEAATRKEVKQVYDKIQTFTVSNQELKDGLAGNTVYTDKDGKELVKTKDGDKFKYTLKDSGQEVDPSDVVISLKDANGKTVGQGITLSNVKSNLKDENVTSFVNGENSEIKNSNAATLGDLQKIASNGVVKFTGNNANVITENKFGEIVAIKGEGVDSTSEFNSASGNIKVDVADDKKGLNIKLSKNLKNLESAEFNGKGDKKIIINNEGIKVGDVNISINGDITGAKIDSPLEYVDSNGNVVDKTKATSVRVKDNLSLQAKDGLIAKGSKEVVNGGQIYEIKEMATQANENANLALGGVSNAVAMANLVQVSSSSNYRHNLSAAYGYYGGSHALAIGFSGTNENRNFVYKLSGAVNNRGNLALGIGAGIMVGNVDNNNSSKDRVKELETIVKKQDEKLKDQDKKMKLLEQKLEELSKKIR